MTDRSPWITDIKETNSLHFESSGRTEGNSHHHPPPPLRLSDQLQPQPRAIAVNKCCCQTQAPVTHTHSLWDTLSSRYPQLQDKMKHQRWCSEEESPGTLRSDTFEATVVFAQKVTLAKHAGAGDRQQSRQKAGHIGHSSCWNTFNYRTDGERGDMPGKEELPILCREAPVSCPLTAPSLCPPRASSFCYTFTSLLLLLLPQGPLLSSLSAGFYSSQVSISRFPVSPHACMCVCVSE